MCSIPVFTFRPKDCLTSSRVVRENTIQDRRRGIFTIDAAAPKIQIILDRETFQNRGSRFPVREYESLTFFFAIDDRGLRAVHRTDPNCLAVKINVSVLRARVDTIESDDRVITADGRVDAFLNRVIRVCSASAEIGQSGRLS